MSVSVVIPAYKARRFLPDCLESIGRQTRQVAEVLVIDDVSPEPVDDIIEGYAARDGYPPIRLIRHEVNRGQAAGRNTGAAASDSQYIAFVDCDDIWAPGHIESALSTLERGADLCFCPASLFEKQPGDLGFIEGPMTQAEESLDPLALLKRCFIIMSSVVVRRGLFEKLGGFDEDSRMRAVEDLDFFMRALEGGARFAMAPDATLHYRKHASSATGQPTRMAFQRGHVTATHAHRFGGRWFANQSLVSRVWWREWNRCVRHRKWRPDLGVKALVSGLPVPWEIGRGLVRMLRLFRKPPTGLRIDE